MVRFWTKSLMLRVFPEAGETRAAARSPTGDPPIQFWGLDQKWLATPVQVCVAGARRSSSCSRPRCGEGPGLLRARERDGDPWDNRHSHWERIGRNMEKTSAR